MLAILFRLSYLFPRFSPLNANQHFLIIWFPVSSVIFSWGVAEWGVVGGFKNIYIKLVKIIICQKIYRYLRIFFIINEIFVIFKNFEIVFHILRNILQKYWIIKRYVFPGPGRSQRIMKNGSNGNKQARKKFKLNNGNKQCLEVLIYLLYKRVFNFTI